MLQTARRLLRDGPDMQGGPAGRRLARRLRSARKARRSRRQKRAPYGGQVDRKLLSHRDYFGAARRRPNCAVSLMDWMTKSRSPRSRSAGSIRVTAVAPAVRWERQSGHQQVPDRLGRRATVRPAAGQAAGPEQEHVADGREGDRQRAETGAEVSAVRRPPPRMKSSTSTRPVTTAASGTPVSSVVRSGGLDRRAVATRAPRVLPVPTPSVQCDGRGVDSHWRRDHRQRRDEQDQVSARKLNIVARAVMIRTPNIPEMFRIGQMFQIGGQAGFSGASARPAADRFCGSPTSRPGPSFRSGRSPG